MSLAEGEEVAVGAVLLVGALGEGAIGIVCFVGGEDFLYLRREEGIVGFAIFFFVVGYLFFLVIVGGGELDNAGVVAAVVLGTIHEGWDDGRVGN